VFTVIVSSEGGADIEDDAGEVAPDAATSDAAGDW
jgi:hypothetical protein